MTDAAIAVDPDLREQDRAGGWVPDFDGAVRRAFAEPDLPAALGWEPLSATKIRVVAAIERIARADREADLALVGHGTTWTVAVAALSGRSPDVAAWERLQMPDLVALDLSVG